ncbi:MAG: hypothetical protein KF851_08950 [Pirellulaceae bacterium]|nr:hypothetical protein [Pirellulaceae bacterium]
MGFIVWLATAIVHLAVAIVLSRKLGLASGLAVYSLIAVAMTAVAGILLRTSTVNTITWKNRFASWLLPWTRFVGGGSLISLLVKNGIASIAIGAVLVVCDQVQPIEDVLFAGNAATNGQLNWVNVVVSGLTVLCWLAMAVAWGYVLRSLFRHHSDTISVLLRKRSFWIPLTIPPIAVTASLYLRYAGQYRWALLVVAVPLLIALIPVIALMSVVVFHWLTGKPIRWN